MPHELEPTGENCPYAHAVHDDAPALEYLPAGHGSATRDSESAVQL